MIYTLAEEFKEIIKEVKVLKYDSFGDSFSLVALITFKDGSRLYVRDYFIQKKHKYSYHWQDAEGNLIIRWDNSPHHKNIKTFPHHRHRGDVVEESYETTLEEVLKFIRDTLIAHL